MGSVVEATRSQIEHFLTTWANSGNSPHFAVLLEGRWGCGKTHFVLEMLGKESFTERRIIYLSLFGISDVATLETQLFYASASTAAKWTHKGIGIAGTILKGTLRIDLDGDNKPDGTIDGKLDGVDGLVQKAFKNLDGSILVLDDLERCKIDSAELLGLVNRYVEHGDTRVVLVANSEAIGDSQFTAFQEKVVGYSFLVPSDPQRALKSFIASIENSKIRDLVSSRQSEIQELHQRSNYHNLRALRQYTWLLSEVLGNLEAKYLRIDALVDSIVRQLFIFFVEFKLDLSEEAIDLSPSDLIGKFDRVESQARHVYELSTNRGSEPSAKQKALQKYEAHSGIRTVVTVLQWISILKTGVIDNEWLNREVAESDEVLGGASWPAWRRLWHFHEWDFREDPVEIFERDIAEVATKLSRGEYVNLREFLHVAGVQIMLANYNLTDRNLPEVVSELKSYISDELMPKLSIEHYRSFEDAMGRVRGGYDGLEYMCSEKDEFQEVRDHLFSEMDAWHSNWLENGAGSELLGYLSADFGRFLGNITVVNDCPEQRYLREPVLSWINPSDFVDSWIALSRQNERKLVASLQSRYAYEASLLESEGPWWRAIQDELAKRRDEETAKPRSAQLSRLIDAVERDIIGSWKVSSGEEGGDA